MKLAVLGSTGSIGTQTLEVVEARGGAITVAALAAGRNIERLSEQIQRFRPALVSVAGAEQASQLELLIDTNTTNILHGEDGLKACVAQSGADRVVNALVGAAGLTPTLTALETGVDLALANKESLVIGGALVLDAQKKSGARLIPIDSEHSALWQLIEPLNPEDIERVLITASGGALRGWPLEALAEAAPDDVLAHPNWRMGGRITVDSATLVNKAFEVIEAHHLFGLPLDCISAVLHPQSLVHGMVELKDGATLAHIGTPDMKVAIQYALTAPRHRLLETPRLDWSKLRLDFYEIDPQRYPSFETILCGHRKGGATMAALNAADEVLVARFLNREIPLTRIAEGLQAVLDRHNCEPISLSAIRAADQWARSLARDL